MHWFAGRFLVLISALVLALPLSVATAPSAALAGQAAPAGHDAVVAAPPPFDCLLPEQPGFERRGFYHFSCAWCEQVGEAGLSRGDWREYRCVPFPIGLDIVYYLYVRV